MTLRFMNKDHAHISDIRQLAGSTQWMALNDDGYMDADVRVTSCGDGVFILESQKCRTFWQQHSDDCAFHSGMLSDMTNEAQALIVAKLKEARHAR